METGVDGPAGSPAPADYEQQPVDEREGELGDEELDRMMNDEVAFHPEVESFLRNLHDHVYVRCVESTRRVYEVDFPSISEKFYSIAPWPAVDDVSTFYRRHDRYHPLIMTLYRDLYFRHLYMRCLDRVTMQDRKDSWENYTLLIDFFAHTIDTAKERDTIALPLQWLWDMLDEFVYQFLEASRYMQRRCKMISDPRKNVLLQEVDADAEIWHAPKVLELLQKLVQHSGIKTLLQQQKKDPVATKGIEGEIGYQLGYFALLMQLKIEVAMGSFYSAIKAVEEIELSPKALYWRVPSAHMSLVFNLGFAYMMLRRYQDAIRVMSQALLAITRQRGQLAAQGQIPSHHQATVARSSDRMHVLLLLCANLSGAKLDDAIMQTIKERYSDKYYKLQQDTDEAYCELFTFAAPRFVDPSAPPTYDEEAFERYVSGRGESRVRISKLFLQEVESRRKVNTINTYAKLYHNIPLNKLATLMNTKSNDPESQTRADLMAAKMKGQQRIWRQGKLLNGEVQLANADSNAVDFKIDGDMVHVKNQQTQRVHVDFFVKQIERTDGMIQALSQTMVPSSALLGQQPQQQSNDANANDSRDRRKPQFAY